MNDHKKAECLQAKYPEGTRIQLTAMAGERDMPEGLVGTVDFVDDIGQLHMQCDNGRSLALVPGEDHFTVFSKPKPRQEQKQKPDTPIIGVNGNIFNLLGIASRTLKAAGMRKQVSELVLPAAIMKENICRRLADCIILGLKTIFAHNS